MAQGNNPIDPAAVKGWINAQTGSPTDTPKAHAIVDMLLGFDKSTICRRLQFMLPLLRAVTTVDLCWPDEQQRPRDWGTILQDFPDLEVLVDATEQRIRRPKSTPEQDTQRAYYSGKKKK